MYVCIQWIKICNVYNGVWKIQIQKKSCYAIVLRKKEGMKDVSTR